MSDLVDLDLLTGQAARLVEAARAAGADAADAIAVRSVNQVASVLKGKVEKIEHAENDDFGLRVFVGDRNATISATLGSDVEALAARAVAMARAASPDRFAGLADPSRLADPAVLARELPNLDLLDETPVSAAELAERGKAIEAAAMAVDGVTNIAGASAYWARGGVALVTSTGFSGAYETSSHGHSVAAIAGTGTGMERDWDSSSKNHLADVESADVVGTRAGERAVRRLNPRKVETRTATVVYDPRVATSLIGALIGGISGASIARKSSFLKDKLGAQLFGSSIRITDDPLRRRGPGSRPCDGEGVYGEALDLVSGGVLQTWLLDSATARELGLETNGRAGRGTGAPSPSSTNVLLHPGSVTPQELIASIGDGLYVTDFIGHGANLVTGDYSRGAAGFWIENGEIAYPVAEITVAGNLLDMFREMVPANDIEFRSAFTAPTVAIGGLTIAGR
jgi:PmbA protein